MKKIAALSTACLLAAVTHADLIAGWDFQTTTNGGTAAAAAPGSPLAYTANFGSGTIYLNGTNGSTLWSSLASSPQVTSFGGTAVNAGTGFSTVTSGSSALTLANSSSNGFRLVFKFSMVGFEDLAVSYATRGTSAGFSSQAWSYSTNASTWTPLETITGTTSTSYSTKTLATITSLDNTPNAYLSIVFTGASDNSGNNRLDNIQLNATLAPVVPEPATAGLLAIGLLVLRRFRRR